MAALLSAAHVQAVPDAQLGARTATVLLCLALLSVPNAVARRTSRRRQASGPELNGD
ncbi:hypothetical protein [Streptomyces sp. SM11]|uniref:hypothetical protein n=1 Tax=Streptomyces sp. SM11 TaxID=565557 RepID=UPI0015E1A63B|nr:hypothetical protein [Streptomyces sp. SM11]